MEIPLSDGRVRHTPSKGQLAVANGMLKLAKEQGKSPAFILNMGDNFYENGVGWNDYEERFREVVL